MVYGGDVSGVGRGGSDRRRRRRSGVGGGLRFVGIVVAFTVGAVVGVLACKMRV